MRWPSRIYSEMAQFLILMHGILSKGRKGTKNVFKSIIEIQYFGKNLIYVVF